MLVQEFSDQFDVLYNNITSNQAPGLNEYEKSVFLTKAQEELVKNYFNPKGNKYAEGFDGNAKRQSDFSSLIKHEKLTEVTLASFDMRSTTKLYAFPSDVFIVLNEQLKDNQWNYVVVPINYQEYDRLMAKPYKYPPKYQAWRLIVDKKTNAVPTAGGVFDTTFDETFNGEDTYLSNVTVAEIIGRFSGEPMYSMRYVKRPQPIVLVNLNSVAGGLSINNVSTVTPCELPEHLHDEILQRAVELAKTAWTSNGQDNYQAVMQAGQRSE